MVVNDLTKEDLQILTRCIHETIVRNDPWEDPCLLSIHRTLREKIQSMIDSYCEHEWRTNPYDFILYCGKCGITKNSNKQLDIL